MNENRIDYFPSVCLRKISWLGTIDGVSKQNVKLVGR